MRQECVGCGGGEGGRQVISMSVKSVLNKSSMRQYLITTAYQKLVSKLLVLHGLYLTL